MQEQAFSTLGIKAYYLVFELGPENLKKVWKNIGRMRVSGFNVTVPYKETVIGFLKSISPEARRIGAVNTVYLKGGKWCGTNTDVYGFLTSLKQEARFEPKRKSAVVLGAGGAARAVVYGLAAQGARGILLVNRNLERASVLAAEYRSYFPRTEILAVSAGDRGLEQAVRNADLVVNATSLGLKKNDPLPLELKNVPKASGADRKVFYDLIYSPAETPFLRNAAKRGHKTLNGVGMLVLQGAKAFEYWTGKRAPVAVMRRALSQAIEERES